MAENPLDAERKEKSVSLFRLRWRRFRRIKRGYYSFVLLLGAYLLSFLLPFIMGNRAIVVRYKGEYYFPALRTYLHETFGIGLNRIYLGEVFDQTEVDGERVYGETNYRALREQLQQEGKGNFAILPPIPYGPNEQFLNLKKNPPNPPSWDHWLGTDDRGRDILVRLAYGFRISISFALLVTGISYAFGTLTGAVLGYFGSWIDILGLRLVEIWGAIPFLYTVIILASLFTPSFPLLVLILASFGWMTITYYIRGEFYREKAKDYVAAAVAVGEGNLAVILKHILPNALIPIISLAPFAIVMNISSLVALDFLGFGLPVPTPSWGELLKQGKQNILEWHLTVFPLLAIFITLQLIVFIGEAVREAFDPKVFSRLR